MQKTTVLGACLITLLPAFALASETVNGSFTASKACEAYASFAKGTNPGAVQLKPGSSYTVREVNRPGNYERLRVEVPGASPELRWVARDCGTAALGGDTAAAPSAASPAAPPQHGQDGPQDSPGSQGGQGNKREMCSTANQQDSYLLALSWQPGFCEHTPRTAGKPECAAMDKGSLVVSNLTLHGLWPNKKACGTSYGNCDGKPFALKKETVAHIAPWMPNFYYENSFGKYEWNKHGTCQALDPDAYFTKAVAAVQLVNASAIGEQILKNIGGAINADKFFATLRSQYGEAAASRVMLVCAGQSYLQEIRVQLPVDFSVDKGMAGLLGAAPGQGPQTSRCGSEIRIEASGRN
jgi:ribonuclease T2